MESPSETRYRFPQGVPAFEQDREFILCEAAGWRPFVTLTSAREGGPHFVCVEVAALEPGYCVELSVADAGSIEAPPGVIAARNGLLRVLAIVAMLTDGTLTANLSAPVVLNPAAGLGVQSIQPDSHYSPVTVIRRGAQEQAC